jgi:type II secretory pathway component HofQ
VECVSLILALVVAAQQPRPSQMPTLPLTQLDDRGLVADLDNRTFSLAFAQPAPIQDVLVLIVRGTSIGIVLDPAIGGWFVGELKNVTVRRALALILRPLGLDYALDGTVVRVFKREPETRIFDLNYIAAERTGPSTVSAGAGPDAVSVSTSTKPDVFGDLANGVRTLLTDHALFNVDRKAGLLQVTDFPERLDRVSVYLEAVQDRLYRQVQIEARVIEVEVNDEKAAGIDWGALAAGLSGAQTTVERARPRPSLTGVRVTDLATFLDLLATQGKVSVVASPRVLTMNNEPSVVRTGAVTFSVTPQISSDAVVTLSLSPTLESAVAIEFDMIARVADGETLVVSGFAHEREVRERKAVGISGGWFGRGTVVTRKRVELVILLTPKIVAGVATQ